VFIRFCLGESDRDLRTGSDDGAVQVCVRAEEYDYGRIGRGQLGARSIATGDCGCGERRGLFREHTALGGDNYWWVVHHSTEFHYDHERIWIFFKLYLYTAIATVSLSAFDGELSQNVGRVFIKSYRTVSLDGAVFALA
jgi:hypothetical protein